MNDTVVDSSAVAKWIIAEPDSSQAQRLLSEAALQGKRLIVLDLVFVEVANAIWKLHHRGLATLDEARLFLDKLSNVSVDIQAACALLKPALEIAAKYDRAVYDALFVALCQNLGLAGVTADEPLYKAIHNDFPQISLLRNWVP
jgi:predicted nucleic acid-binding protein